jgi:probable HAF family extracellular repeat protein
MIDLGTLGGLSSEAHGINDRGDVVGFADIATVPPNGFFQHPFLYHDGTMFDLSTLISPTDPLFGKVNLYPMGINNSGQIVAYGCYDTTTRACHAFRLDPVPAFAGTPGKANCHGQSVSALAKQYGGLNSAAAALGYSDVSALQNAIMAFCEG